MTILTLLGVTIFTVATAFFFGIGKLIHPTSPAAAASWIFMDVMAVWAGVVLAWLGIWGGRERFVEDIPSKNSAPGLLLTVIGTALGIWLSLPLVLVRLEAPGSP